MQPATLARDLIALSRLMSADVIAHRRCTGCDFMTRADLLECKSNVVFWGAELCPVCVEEAEETADDGCPCCGAAGCSACTGERGMVM